VRDRDRKIYEDDIKETNKEIEFHNEINKINREEGGTYQQE